MSNLIEPLRRRIADLEAQLERAGYDAHARGGIAKTGAGNSDSALVIAYAKALNDLKGAEADAYREAMNK